MMGCSSKILAAQGKKVQSHDGASASHKLVYPHPVQGNIILPNEALLPPLHMRLDYQSNNNHPAIMCT